MQSKYNTNTITDKKDPIQKQDILAGKENIQAMRSPNASNETVNPNVQTVNPNALGLIDPGGTKDDAVHVDESILVNMQCECGNNTQQKENDDQSNKIPQLGQ